jgi:arginyl-tRNA synthetase
MNIYAIYQAHVLTALDQLIANGTLPADIKDLANFSAVVAEPPRDRSHGDIATNAAMVIAKKAGMNPRALAEALKPELDKIKDIASVEIAGPGFINLRLTAGVWQRIIPEILKSGIGFGNSNIGNGEAVNIEYVSANPTGPMHVGHARGAVVGDATANLLIKAGYDVTKEYYINDAGGQVDVLARSAHLRYREACGEDIGDIPEGLYPGDYLVVVGESFKEKWQHEFLDCDEHIWLPILKPFALECMMEMIKADLADLGVVHDVFSSEKQLQDDNAVARGVQKLRDAGLIYQGVLEPPKGKTLDDWEPREQTLFKSSEYGDDVDRPIQKSDGAYTYFASDIAYHADKISRGFNKMVIALGADHGGYVKRLQAAVSALSNKKANIDVLLYQLVNLTDNGHPVKMSKRAGTYVTVKDVVEAVGKDVLRFIMLTRKADATLDFDLKKVTEQSKENPVFYVQYAHARIQSVLRNSAELPDVNIDDLGTLDTSAYNLLNHSAELQLIQQLAGWPRALESAATSVEPHRVAFYVQDVAASFHSLWNAGKDDSSLRFLVDDNAELTQARLSLIKATATTIASALQVMGVEPLMEM